MSITTQVQTQTISWNFTFDNNIFSNGTSKTLQANINFVALQKATFQITAPVASVSITAISINANRVWVNNNFLGTASISGLDVTQYIKPGQNQIVIEYDTWIPGINASASLNITGILGPNQDGILSGTNPGTNPASGTSPTPGTPPSPPDTSAQAIQAIVTITVIVSILVIFILLIKRFPGKGGQPKGLAPGHTRQEIVVRRA